MNTWSWQSIIGAGIGVLIGLLFFWASALWLKLIFLFIALLLLIFSFLTVIASTRWVPISIPGYVHSPLATHLSALICGAYYFIVGQSFLWQLLCALGMLFVIGKVGRIAIFVFLSTVALRRLQSDFREGVYPRLAPPHILVAGAPGSGLRHLRRIIYKVTQNLWKFRAQSSQGMVSSRMKAKMEDNVDNIINQEDEIKEEYINKLKKYFESAKLITNGLTKLIRDILVTELLYERSLVVFITSSDLRRYSISFQKYVAGNSASIVSSPTSLSRFKFAEENEIESEKNKADNIQEQVDEKVPSFLSGWIGGLFEKTSEIESDVSRQIHLSRGPAFLFFAISSFEIAEGFDKYEDEDSHALNQGYETIHKNRKRLHSTSKPVAHIVDTVDNVTIPVARSDARLGSRLREGISAIGKRGLAPLADCYLRFRLAESDVERFLGLIDCFEVLIKYSLLTLVSVEEQEPHDMSRRSIFERLERPSMGTWIHLLREAKKNTAQESTGLSSSITGAWDQSLEGAPRNLISTVNGAGLAWPGTVPRSHMEWLNWLVWLRNKTKGHGGVEESTCTAVWHDFHETFLQVALDLSDLTLHSTLRVKDTNEQSVPMRGWIRGHHRSSTFEIATKHLQERAALPIIEYRNAQYPLAPFVLFEENSCLTWNSGDDEEAEYIDYSTGKITELPVEPVFSTTSS